MSDEPTHAYVGYIDGRCVMTFVDQRAADRLADEVAVLVRRKIIDARSPAGDALLDYREPPPSERSDRMADLERERDAARTEVDARHALLVKARAEADQLRAQVAELEARLTDRSR